jgi:hypothetical protein
MVISVPGSLRPTDQRLAGPQTRRNRTALSSSRRRIQFQILNFNNILPRKVCVDSTTQLKCHGGSSPPSTWRKNMKEDTPKAGQREVETRRIGLQNRLKEDVKDAKHDPTAQKRARDARFASTGEPCKAGKK